MTSFKEKLLLLVLLIPIFSACNFPAGQRREAQTVAQISLPLPTATHAEAAPTQEITVSVASPTETPTPTSTSTDTLVPTLTLTATPLPSPTPTPTPIPTYVNLRGEVIVEQASCRYGPGAPYLFKYLLIGGSNLEIIGRNELGTWVEIRAIGGNNPCWVKADLMKIKGDVMDVAPLDPQNPDTVGIPFSPYYFHPPTGVSATRNGNEVTVFWDPYYLKEGDDSEQFPYLVEAWVCKNGQMVFTPTGSYQTAVKIVDEPGCSMPSHARLYAVEKHGYTHWVKIPWPVF